LVEIYNATVADSTPPSPRPLHAGHLLASVWIGVNSTRLPIHNRLDLKTRNLSVSPVDLYSLDLLRPILTAEVCEAVDWLADLRQQTMAASRPVEWRHFVEVNSRNLGGGHVCWGSYDGFNSAGWHSGCEWHQCCPSCCATKRLKLLKLPQKYGENHSLHHMFSSSTARHLREETLFTFFSSLMPVPHKLTVFVEV